MPWVRFSTSSAGVVRANNSIKSEFGAEKTARPSRSTISPGGRRAYACGLAAGVAAGAGGVSVSGPLAGDGFASLGFGDDGTRSLRD